jgi:hypothetical protein
MGKPRQTLAHLHRVDLGNAFIWPWGHSSGGDVETSCVQSESGRQQYVKAPGTNAGGDRLFFLGLPVFLTAWCREVSAVAVNHSSCAEEEARTFVIFLSFFFMRRKDKVESWWEMRTDWQAKVETWWVSSYWLTSEGRELMRNELLTDKQRLRVDEKSATDWQAKVECWWEMSDSLSKT